jgi:hypothetical protein
MNRTPCFEEWETYPENLPANSCNAYRYDYQAYKGQFKAVANRLFVSSMRICVKVVEIGPHGEFFALKLSEAINNECRVFRPAL